MRNNLNGVPYTVGTSLPGVSFAAVSCSAKLSPVLLVDDGKGARKKPVPQGPFCSSTYVSIRATCPDSCAFKDNGCYAQNGTSRRIMKKLDEEAESSYRVSNNEAAAMKGAFGGGMVPQDGARGGRDLRLHVGGDVGSAGDAGYVASEARQWRVRGGGAVWTYTHRWREIPITAWAGIRVWASCETLADVRAAQERGYRAALVRDSFPTERRHLLGDFGELPTVKVVPCPYETRGVTCVKCRLCLDAPIERDVVIGFRAHGQGLNKARGALRRRRLEVVS
jgi:hypothetical protein